MRINQSGFTIAHGLLVFLVFSVATGTGLYVYNQSNKVKVADAPVLQKAADTVPADWQDFKTEFGFSIKMPPGWTGGVTSNTTYNGITHHGLALSNPDSSSQDDSSNSVTVGTLSIKGKTSEAALDEYLANIKQEALKTYKSLGYPEAQTSVTVSVSTLQIGGTTWRQSETNMNGIITKSLLRWHDDHAIELFVMSEDKKTIDKLASDYLVPMAASVTLN